jgi:hypothetical protein
VTKHDLDLVSLVGGIVFLALGVVGLLRSSGRLDGGAVFWAAVAGLIGLGIVGAARSLWALSRRGDTPVGTENGPK